MLDMYSFIIDILIYLFFSVIAEVIHWGYKQYKLSRAFPEKWREILLDKVAYYRELSPEDQKKFEKRIVGFLVDYKLKSVNSPLTDTDKMLVASSAIIPVFAFKNWYYPDLKKIYLFDEDFRMNHPMIPRDASIKGLVGQGKMKGKMYLSKKSLYESFSGKTSGKNTGIHEFLHLIDMEDGDADGIPEVILEKAYIIPWVELIKKEIERVCREDSVLSENACNNEAEFFAEAGTYFFENPELLAEKHPELFEMLEKIFGQKRRRKTSLKKIS